MKRLGILVTAETSAQWVLGLACSACSLGIEVRVHLTGSAARIACTPVLAGLMKAAAVTICRSSAEQFLTPDQQAACTRLMGPPEKKAEVIAGCDRHLIL